MHGGHEGLRTAFERVGAEDGEEIGAHGIPVHAAQARHPHAHRFAGNIKLQFVAQRETKRFRKPRLERDFVACAVKVAASADLAGLGKTLGVRQVEFALDQSLRPGFVVIGCAQWFAVA